MEHVFFGHYVNAKDGTAEPIEWRVLAARDGKRLLITEYALELRPYHERLENVTWAQCALRAWLNGGFYARAFTADEKSRILQTEIMTEGEPDTTDRLFILSAAEAEDRFSSPADMQAIARPYVREQGAFTNAEGGCWWWLRNRGRSDGSCALVDIIGGVYAYGLRVDSHAVTVRPAMWISD